LDGRISEAHAANITISNSTFINVEKPNVIDYIDGLVLKDVAFYYVRYPALAKTPLGMLLIVVIVFAYIAENSVHQPILIKTPLGVVDMSKEISLSKALIRGKGAPWSASLRASEDEREKMGRNTQQYR
jgi:hypothetical protein